MLDPFTSICPLPFFTFSKRAQVRNPEEVAEILGHYFEDKDREELVAVLLDTANTVIGLTTVSIGSLSASLVDPAQVFKPAILANAASIIVAHNHPSGNREPSREDVQVTKKLTKAAEMLDIPLRDHLIVTEEGYTSLRERDLMR